MPEASNNSVPTGNKNSSQVTDQANFIWNIANKLRGAYMPDKYGDVIIPMTIVRRFECSLADTKKEVLENYEKNNNLPAQFLYKISGYQFYNTSRYTLAELCNDPNNIAANFKEYISGFSQNVRDILSGLELDSHIKKMDKEGCLYSVVKDFSELDLSPKTYDSVQMGYIFENLIGRFFENVDAGQFYTGRDIIKMLVEVLMSESCDDLKDPQKVVTVCDQACGTGGMLSTAFDSIKAMNPSANVRLFGQEYNSVSWSIGLAEMLIKGQNSENFRHADTFKEDCFPNQKMRLVIENPPFGTPWSGKDAKQGQEDAVRAEYRRGKDGRWGAGLPSGGDSQLLFMQSAIDKMDDRVGRAAIIQNGSSLYNNRMLSGESQILRWMLEMDYIESIIALPTDLFYNTPLQTYVWILSKNKRQERKGKIQLINAASLFHRLRKPLGDKKNYLGSDDIRKIIKLYKDFQNDSSELSKIYDNENFIYREYSVMQPLQRSYAVTAARIENMLSSGCLNALYDEAKVYELENADKLSSKDQKKLDGYRANKEIFDVILEKLENAKSDKKYNSPEEFEPVLNNILADIELDKKIIVKIMDGLSEIDKSAKIQTKHSGEILYDEKNKDTEIVSLSDDIDEYMQKNVIPYTPDAKYFDDDKIGASIPFTRCFYRYRKTSSSSSLEDEILILNKMSINKIDKTKIENRSVSQPDSSIEWLGGLPADWELKRISALYTPRVTKVSDEKYKPLSVTMQGVLPQLENVAKTDDHSNRKLVKKGDFAINSRSDRRGSCGISEYDGSVSLINTVLRPSQKNNLRYYNWLFHTTLFADEYYKWGHGIVDDLWTTNWQDMKNIYVPVPPLDEQTKIANYLDEKCAEIDKVIEDKKKEIEKLKEYRDSIIFECVTGKKKVA